MPRVLVADDSATTRMAICLTLAAAGLEVCADVDTAAGAVEAAQALHPDVALLDVRMPGGGVEAARAIHATVPRTAVVMLTATYDEQHLVDALRAGAVGYLTKDIAPERLADALLGVVAGEAAVPRGLLPRVLAELQRTPTSGRSGALARLTDREYETLQLLRDGLSTSEIAVRQFVAPVTVRTHVAAIVRKLRVADRAAAVELAGLM